MNNVYEEINRTDFQNFIGPNFRRFERIRAMKARGRRYFVWGWPWLGALYPPIWFAYRKLYLLFVVYNAGAITVLLLDLLRNEPLSFAMTYVWGGVALSLFLIGRLAVVNRAITVINEADRRGLSGDARKDFLTQKGGVSVLSAVLLPIAFFFILIGILVVADAFGLHLPED